MKQAGSYNRVWVALVDGHVHGPAFLSWESANKGAKDLAKDKNIDPKRVALIALPLEEGEGQPE